MFALCTCCFVTFQAMSSMEISPNVGTPPENLANDEDHLSGSEGTAAAEAPAPGPQPKPAAKPKPKPKPKGSAEINLEDYLTSTKRIRVRWDEILVDRDHSEGQFFGLNPDRVQARYVRAWPASPLAPHWEPAPRVVGAVHTPLAVGARDGVEPRVSGHGEGRGTHTPICHGWRAQWIMGTNSHSRACMHPHMQ